MAAKMKPIFAALGVGALAVAGYFVYDEFFKRFPFGSTEAVVSTLHGNLADERTRETSPASAALGMIAALDPDG